MSIGTMLQIVMIGPIVAVGLFGVIRALFRAVVGAGR